MRGITNATKGSSDVVQDTEKVKVLGTTLQEATDSQPGIMSATDHQNLSACFDDVNISGSHLVFDKTNGEQKEIEIPHSTNPYSAITTYSDLITWLGTANLGDELICDYIGNLSGNRVSIDNAYCQCIKISDSLYKYSATGTCYINNTEYPILYFTFTTNNNMVNIFYWNSSTNTKQYGSFIIYDSTSLGSVYTR